MVKFQLRTAILSKNEGELLSMQQLLQKKCFNNKRLTEYFL
jgi:hypothetical protein